MFYRMEFENDKQEKELMFICRNFKKEIDKDKKYNISTKFCNRKAQQKNSDFQCYRKANYKTFYDTMPLNYCDYRFFESDSDFFYVSEIYDENSDRRQLIILCKTAEELEEEANEHIKKGIKDSVKAIGEGACAAIAAESGHVGVALVETVMAADDLNEAIDEFKQAYECKKEAKTQREEEENKN